jgi:hypothetical protein
MLHVQLPDVVPVHTTDVSQSQAVAGWWVPVFRTSVRDRANNTHSYITERR